MAKLSGWEPKRRGGGTRIHEQKLPSYVTDADEFFSYTTFDLNVQLTTRGKLVQRFYEWNNADDGMKPWILMRLDPQEGAVRHIWYWGHFKGYHAICEQSYFGPHKVHRTRLFYKQAAGSVLWLASCQLGPCYFYSQDKISLAYLTALREKQFYISAAEVDKVVPF